MNTIIRVKRHLQDDPVEAVRLECKRRRTEEAEGPSSFEKVLNFLGTVDNKDDELVSQRTLGISPIYQKRVKDLKSQKPTQEVLSKIRKEADARSKESRFKVISCKRSISNTEESESKGDGQKENIAIVDVSLEKNCDLKNSDCSEDNFVYDIYSANLENDDFNNIFLDNVIGIKPYTSEPIFEYRNPEDYTDEDFDPDEDDSNDENNWRNSYPDEDGSDSEEIDVLTCQFGNIGRNVSYELSSDDGEDKYPNYCDPKDKSDYFFHEAESLGGSSYAKYKSKVMREFNASESFDGDEDEDEETF
ncbi:UNVERIFIED_CONTAM: hypothetical protein PYX00_006347 [Menopon gallinae]|uniref:Probable RNA polymerase II nuclear localization protein SLC7A6OS n=1 Tax=Menopon gallinae TaxID=328185 RepID=A0AAW2HWD7_9NEOP